MTWGRSDASKGPTALLGARRGDKPAGVCQPAPSSSGTTDGTKCATNQGQTDHLGGAQEFPRENLKKTSTFTLSQPSPRAINKPSTRPTSASRGAAETDQKQALALFFGFWVLSATLLPLSAQ